MVVHPDQHRASKRSARGEVAEAAVGEGVPDNIEGQVAVEPGVPRQRSARRHVKHCPDMSLSRHAAWGHSQALRSQLQHAACNRYGNLSALLAAALSRTQGVAEVVVSDVRRHFVPTSSRARRRSFTRTGYPVSGRQSPIDRTIERWHRSSCSSSPTYLRSTKSGAPNNSVSMVTPVPGPVG